MSKEKAEASDSLGVWAAAISTLAAMATVIGLFNKWPQHETIGAFVVAVICGMLSGFAFRAASRWRNLP